MALRLDFSGFCFAYCIHCSAISVHAVMSSTSACFGVNPAHAAVRRMRRMVWQYISMGKIILCCILAVFYTVFCNQFVNVLQRGFYCP